MISEVVVYIYQKRINTSKHLYKTQLLFLIETILPKFIQTKLPSIAQIPNERDLCTKKNPWNFLRLAPLYFEYKLISLRRLT